MCSKFREEVSRDEKTKLKKLKKTKNKTKQNSKHYDIYSLIFTIITHFI